jgi:hypothetical protein
LILRYNITFKNIQNYIFSFFHITYCLCCALQIRTIYTWISSSFLFKKSNVIHENKHWSSQQIPCLLLQPRTCSLFLETPPVRMHFYLYVCNYAFLISERGIICISRLTLPIGLTKRSKYTRQNIFTKSRIENSHMRCKKIRCDGCCLLSPFLLN